LLYLFIYQSNLWRKCFLNNELTCFRSRRWVSSIISLPRLLFLCNFNGCLISYGGLEFCYLSPSFRKLVSSKNEWSFSRPLLPTIRLYMVKLICKNFTVLVMSVFSIRIHLLLVLELLVGITEHGLVVLVPLLSKRSRRAVTLISVLNF